MFVGGTHGSTASGNSNVQSLDALRSLTKWFIDQDPTELIFIGRKRVENDNGSETIVPDSPKSPQRVKLIYTTGQSDGIVQTADGQERKYDFVLVAEFNADIAIDDQWTDGRGNWWVVTGLTPFNGYEVKAMCKSFGKNPSENG